ncbi:MAG: hypothetical protein FK734_11780 [Asgard group archaeon]|nr:hypothetical protein [Asgard group archaeon]
MKEKKIIIVLGILVLGFVSGSIFVQPLETSAMDPFFTLTAATIVGGTRLDYMNLLKQQLARIGINIDIDYLTWIDIAFHLKNLYDYDIFYLDIDLYSSIQDYRLYYSENGSINDSLFGYDTSLDWSEELGTGINEWYLNEGLKKYPQNSLERLQHYWNWQQYLMDKICPCKPMFAPNNYMAYWSNLQGYNYSEGLLQSWGKMSWEGSHYGQSSVDELKIIDKQWSDLNPLFQDDEASFFISKACLDPLIWLDNNLQYWPHLAKSFTFINDTTIEIVCREGIKWAADPDGNFTYEYFDARDVYFTLYSWAHVSNDSHLYEWLKDMEIIDDYTLRIYIDGDKDLPGNQPVLSSLNLLSVGILPEHYLNQTQMADGITPDITHLSWYKYAYNCFGTGLFTIDSYTPYYETVLKVNQDCWWLNDLLTNDPVIDWNNRFGTFDSTINQLIVKYFKHEYEAQGPFESGLIDLLEITDFSSIDYYQTNTDFNVQSKPSLYFGIVGFNMREDRNVIGNRNLAFGNSSLTIGLCIRKAICYAINRIEINSLLHVYPYTIVNQPISPLSGIWLNPDIISYDFNLEQAKHYLSIAGYGGCWTPSTNGFGFFLTIATIFIISVLILKKKQINLR